MGPTKHPQRRHFALGSLLRPHLAAHRRAIGVVIGLQLAQVAAMLYLPALNADIINYGVIETDTSYIVRRGSVMMAITVVQVICAAASAAVVARTAMAVGRDLRSRVFDQVQTFSTREIAQFGKPSLITRTGNDVQQVQTLVLITLNQLVAAPVIAVGAIVMSLGQDVPMSGLLLALVPVLGMVVALVFRRLRPLFLAMQDYVDAVNRVLREQITGIRVVRAFVKDEYERQRFERVNHDLTDVSLRAGRLNAMTFPLLIIVVNIATVPMVWLGAVRIGDGGMSVGALTAMLDYLGLLLTSVIMATSVAMTVPRAEVCAARIDSVLRVEPTVRPPARPVQGVRHRGALRLERATFTYPGAQAAALHEVDLTVEPGSSLALVGSLGSGKSTVLQLVVRLFDPTAGRVLIDGVDVRDLDSQTLSHLIGYVPQRPYLFTGSVAANLRYGRSNASDAELWRALDIAQATRFVQNLPGQLDAPITQGGGNLSGGQRQRLAVARALVRQPMIYLFDDIYAALDLATDAALRAALSEATGNAAVITVDQRLTSARTADTIAVLNDGLVVDVGKHQDLLASSTTYRELVLSHQPRDIPTPRGPEPVAGH